jgi:acetyl esterase/lipase
MPEPIKDIPYGGGHERNVGDLFLPDKPRAGALPVLLIHGGGWNGLLKESFHSFAGPFLDDGRAAFNINYRLLDHAPWPACADDCVRAANFIREGHLQQYGVPAADKVLVCGASAGGHLSMITGLRLGKSRCEATINVSGPSRMDFPGGSSKPHFESAAFAAHFFGRPIGPDEHARLLDTISPARLVTPDAPPLYCIHSEKDGLILPSHSRLAIEAWRAQGVEADGWFFDGVGEFHGLWTDGDLTYRTLLPVVRDIVLSILSRLNPNSRPL